MEKPRLAAFGAVLAFLFAAGTSDREVAAQEKFYQGKTMRIIVGAPPGGFFDLWSRLLARHMGRHIAGNPSMIVQNMPGAGSMHAANHLFGVAKPDGLTFGTVIGNVCLLQLAGAPGVAFNWPEFTFIGRTTGDPAVFYILADLPYKNWRDLRAATKPIPVGSVGAGSTHIVPMILKDVLGFNLQVISGYPGGAPIDVAMERREVEGSGRSTSVYVGREPFLTWHKKAFVRPIAQTGRERDPRLPADVPTVWEIAKELALPEADLKFMETAYWPFDWQWIYVAPPGIPAERVKILREAFHKALRDPALLKEGEKTGLFPDPIDPDELKRLGVQVMKIDSGTAARVKKLLGY